MITIDAILGATKYDTLPAEHKANVKALFAALHDFETAHGKPLHVSSGYRTVEHNKAIGGAPHSNHLTGKACDFSDPDGAIKKWCLANLPILVKLGLYMEHPDSSPTWCHLQTKPTKNRVFRP